MKALFENQNYKAVIDSMRESVADGGDSWEIRGWAIDRLRKQELEISVDAADNIDPALQQGRYRCADRCKS